MKNFFHIAFALVVSSVVVVVSASSVPAVEDDAPAANSSPNTCSANTCSSDPHSAKDVIEEVIFFNIETGKFESLKSDACDFGYRDSVFKNQLKGKILICSVTFKLNKSFVPHTSYGAIEEILKSKSITTPSIKDVSDAVIAIRQSKLPDPEEIGNAGSFFKNPVIPNTTFDQLLKKFPDIPHYKVNENETKIPAGWLIQEAGWKGRRFEHIGIHPKQALVLVNYGGGKGKEIKQLALDIKEDIYEKFGIEITPEVNMI